MSTKGRKCTGGMFLREQSGDSHRTLTLTETHSHRTLTYLDVSLVVRMFLNRVFKSFFSSSDLAVVVTWDL